MSCFIFTNKTAVYGKILCLHVIRKAWWWMACECLDGESTEIKAATYHRMDIQRTERGLETIIVFDV
jgi:hypothetical protein